MRPPSWTDDDRALRDGADGSAPLSIVLEEGTLLARKYRLARTAGFGGMAQLWVATNEATGAEVCIKILVPDSIDDDSVQRFRREAYAAARLSHRAIVRIFDLVELNTAGEDTSSKPSALAIVMELLRGETLGDYLMKKGKLSLEESIDLALPILSALAHAHRAGIIHRDLKPDNIFLATDPDGHVIPKVLDFGVSKVAAQAEKPSRASAPLTLDGVMLGTPSYMSPEQARGARDIDARSDVFSASILVYMMLAGKNPFESETFHSVISAIMERNPPRLPDVPEAIWNVIEKGLAKDAAARYADATELGIALRRACGRTATTESGVHAVTLPASGRRIAVPLGGDSHVSVPPVGNGGDTASNSRPPGMNPPARKLAVRIVATVVAASAALTTVALLRDPQGSSSAAPASATRELPRGVSSTPRPATYATASTTTTATTALTAFSPAATVTGPSAGESATPDAGVPRAGVTGVTAATGTQGAKKVGTSPTAAPAVPGPDGLKEPALVRDPGF